MRNLTTCLLALQLVLCCTIGGSAQVTRHDAIERVVAAYQEQRDFSGVVLVRQGGKLVHRRGYGAAERSFNTPAGPWTRIPIASISKVFVAVGVLQLAEQNRLTLDAPIANYFPQLRSRDAGTITVRQLLTHTSGLPRDMAMDPSDEGGNTAKAGGAR